MRPRAHRAARVATARSGGAGKPVLVPDMATDLGRPGEGLRYYASFGRSFRFTLIGVGQRDR
jgi:hypothetical protein